MPSDANGVYSLPAGYLAVTGETIQASQHNPPLEDLGSAMSARLMRSGAAPMTGPIKIVDGSVGSPAVQFANGASTGFYKTTNGVALSISGTKVAEFGPGGIVSGAHFIGELIPFAGSTAPALTVLPCGQVLLRSGYPDLWTFAQTEIAAGNTFFNNGNGSTTFGIGDLRGRVPAGKDNMGGLYAGRLTLANLGFDPGVLGRGVGLETHLLTTTQIPAHTHANTATASDSGHIHLSMGYDGGSLNAGGGFGGQQSGLVMATTTGFANITVTMSNASAGGGAAHNNVQPTILVNYILFAGA